MYKRLAQPGGRPVTASGGRPSRLKSLLAATAFFFYNAIVTRVPVYAARHIYLRRVLRIRIGRGASVHMGCFFTGRLISIGERTVINRGCYLDGRGGLSIGSDVSVSPECYLLSLTHDVRSRSFAAEARPVRIGDRAWLGARVMILPGVEMGEGAVAGAGSVVTRSCEPYAIVAGSPAKRIGERPRGLEYRLSYFPLFDTDVQL